MRLIRSTQFVVVTALLGVGAFAAPAAAQICDQQVLADSLAAASPGTTVTVGACTVYVKNLTIPPGVTLQGSGRARSILWGLNTAFTAVQAPTISGQTSTIRQLTIQSDTRAGVLATGNGTLVIDRVNVVSTRGIGIGASGLSELTLANVNATGPVTAATAATTPANPLPTLTGTHGIVVVDAAQATFSAVHANGWATFGVSSVNSTLTWTDGNADENVTTGVLVWGGNATLTGVRVRRTYRGDRPEFPTGIAVANGGHATLADVRSRLNEGYGIFVDGFNSALEATNVVAGDNAHAGIWAQGATYVQVDTSSVVDNQFAGLVAVDVAFVSATGTQFLRNQLATPGVGGTAGDGVLAVRTPLDLFDSELGGNGRVGLLAHLAANQPATDLRFSNVTARAPAGILGVVAQRETGQILPVITDGITRPARTLNADTAFVSGGHGLGPTESTPPCFLPPATELGGGGLSALLGQ